MLKRIFRGLKYWFYDRPMRQHMWDGVGQVVEEMLEKGYHLAILRYDPWRDNGYYWTAMFDTKEHTPTSFGRRCDAPTPLGAVQCSARLVSDEKFYEA